MHPATLSYGEVTMSAVNYSQVLASAAVQSSEAMAATLKALAAAHVTHEEGLVDQLVEGFAHELINHIRGLESSCSGTMQMIRDMEEQQARTAAKRRRK